MSILFLAAIICALLKGDIKIFNNEDYMLWAMFSIADALWVGVIAKWMG